MILGPCSPEIMVMNKENKPLWLLSLPSIDRACFFGHFAYIRRHSETSNRNFLAFATLFLLLPLVALFCFVFFISSASCAFSRKLTGVSRKYAGKKQNLGTPDVKHNQDSHRPTDSDDHCEMTAPPLCCTNRGKAAPVNRFKHYNSHTLRSHTHTQH